MSKWYYYLHTNGDVIGKNPVAVEGDVQYFDSPFVVDYWLIDTEDRESLVGMLIELKRFQEKGDDQIGRLTLKRIKEIEEASNITEKDYECFRRIKAGEDRKKVIDEIFSDKHQRRIRMDLK